MFTVQGPCGPNWWGSCTYYTPAAVNVSDNYTFMHWHHSNHKNELVARYLNRSFPNPNTNIPCSKLYLIKETIKLGYMHLLSMVFTYEFSSVEVIQLASKLTLLYLVQK